MTSLWDLHLPRPWELSWTREESPRAGFLPLLSLPRGSWTELRGQTLSFSHWTNPLNLQVGASMMLQPCWTSSAIFIGATEWSVVTQILQPSRSWPRAPASLPSSSSLRHKRAWIVSKSSSSNTLSMLLKLESHQYILTGKSHRMPIFGYRNLVEPAAKCNLTLTLGY